MSSWTGMIAMNITSFDFIHSVANCELLRSSMQTDDY